MASVQPSFTRRSAFFFCATCFLLFFLFSGTRAQAATLLRYAFETSNPWTGMAGYSMAAGGTLTATPVWTTVGTIDSYGTDVASSGIQLQVNSSAATGNWTAGFQSGVLSFTPPTPTPALGLFTLSFSLSASSAYPVRVKIESFDNAATPLRTGGLQSVILPAAANFYQRYALDLNKMTADGAGSFNPAASKVRISFEIDNTTNGTGWPAAAGHSLKIDNLNFSTPKYYVKPGGAGTKDGLTEANALASVQAAVNKSLTGDNIIAIMEDATPGGVDYEASNINGDLVNISKPGAPDAWIVFRNYPGHAPVLRSNGWVGVRICNNTSGGSAAYVEVRGLTIRGNSSVDANGDRQIDPAYQPYVGLVDSRSNGGGVSVDGGFNKTNRPHHVRVADNILEYLAGGNGGGGGDRFTYENNIVRYNCWWTIYANSGISFGSTVDTELGDSYRMLIQNNIVYGNEGMIPWKLASNPYSDGNGIIIDSLTASYTGRTLIQNNLVYNNGGSGIHVLKSSNVDIVHNTAYFNSASSSEAYGQIFTQSTGSDPGSWVKNVNVVNNIMVAPRRNVNTSNSYLFNESATGVASYDPSTLLYKRNVYVGGDSTPNLSGANLSDNTDRGRSYDPALVFISPSVDPNVADFRLRLAAANNYGAAIGYRSVRDLVGTPRLLTGPTDTGAYQTISGLAFSPTFSPGAGNYAASQSLTLASDTSGAKIVYTTNGSTPTVDASGNPTNGTVYPATTPATVIPISAATTVKAIAWKSGFTTSPVSTSTYTFQDLTALPVILTLETPTGTYPGTKVSQPLTRTPGALFRYTSSTTPGATLADPTATTGTPQEYRGFPVLDYATLRYQAYKPGRANSPVLSTTITIRAQMGNLEDGTSVTTIGANKIRFVRFEAANNFSAGNLYARLSGAPGNYRAAIYSSNSGAPNKLLASSNLVTNPVNGWNVFQLTSRASLTKTSSNNRIYYWLAIWSDNAGAGIYSLPTGGVVREASSTFSSIWLAPTAPTEAAPDANVAATSDVTDTANYAIYAMNLPPNLAPVVNAGVDQNIGSATSASLAGTVGHDGVPLAPGTVTQIWLKVSGPGTVTFANPTATVTNATFSTSGTYVLRLAARDALLTASDDLTVVVGTSGTGPTDPAPPAGVVRSNFSDGLGTAYPQQYPGISGDGWASAWIASTNVTVSVPGASPLKSDSGNYLNVVRTTAGTGQEGVYRQFSGTTRPTNQFARLVFDVRLDSTTGIFNTSNDSLAVSLRTAAGASPANDSSFLVRAFGGAIGSLQAREWGVYSGDGTSSGYDVTRFRPTGMICQPGVNYTFTVDLFGANAAGTTGGKAHGTYDVTISDGTNTVTVLGSRFRSTAYSFGTYLSFSTASSASTDNLAFSADSIELTSLSATATSLATSANPAAYGELITFTATVSSAGGGVPTGSVTFLDNNLEIGSAPVNGTGLATLSTSALETGSHIITAVYPTGPTFTASASAAITQVVGASTTTDLVTSQNPATLASPITFTAFVQSDSANPTGTVSFYDGDVLLGSGALDEFGNAAFTTSSLSVGFHDLYAAYNGDVANSPSLSSVLNQNIQRPDGTTRLSAINAAGPALVGSGFAADTGFSGGTVTSSSAAINLTGVSYSAPTAVYQTERYGAAFSYTLNGLTPSAGYLVRLHFSENYWGLGGRPGPAKRFINLSINGTQRLSAFEIYAAAGNNSNKAVIREFAAKADLSGQLLLNFTSTVINGSDSNALVDGLEIYTLTPADAWRVANFTPTQLDNPAFSGTSADPDNDGISNLLERALGLNPLVSSTAGLPTASVDSAGTLSINFFRAASDLTYTVEGSGNLQNWSTILPVNPGLVGQNVSLSDNASPGVAPRFLRLRISQ